MSSIQTSSFIGPLPEGLERRSPFRFFGTLPAGIEVNTIWTTTGKIPVAYFHCQINVATTPEMFDLAASTIHDYNVIDAGYNRATSLVVAADQGNNNLVSHIYKIGGEILLDIGDQNGWTPLIWAAHCKNRDNGFIVVKTLLSFGAKLNVMSTDGMTPLWAAAKNRNYRLVKLFLMNGAISDPWDKEANASQLIEQVREELQADGEKRHLIKVWNHLQSKTPSNNRLHLPPDIFRLIFKYMRDSDYEYYSI